MLVLSRREGQRIHLGNNVVITIVLLENNRVRIGIDAPREVSIRRSELEKIENIECELHETVALLPQLTAP